MRITKWMMAVALALLAPVLHADGGDNDRDRGHGGPGPGQGQESHPAPSNNGGPAQVQQRFPTAGAFSGGGGPSRPAKRSAPHPHGQGHHSNPPASAPPQGGGATAPGSSANSASHIQKRPHQHGTAGRSNNQGGPTSNIPGVAHAAQPDLNAQREAGHQKLANLGVKAAPRPMDQSKLVRSSAEQSRVTSPSQGPDHRALPSRQVDLRHFSGAGMGARMQGLSAAPRMAEFGRMNAQEREPGRYYWHEDGGRRYCHYMDPWGYQWYGWYGDDDVLWVRYYDDRWWNYDADMGRWLYWDDGQWWWQDDVGGGVYVYVDGGYILD
jgi:hypothetical protein